MKIANKNKFTWGAEIEGHFKIKFRDELFKLFRSNKYSNINLNITGDGSVDNLYDMEIQENSNINAYNWKGKEMKLGIFRKYDDMINILSLFENGNNYLRNDSCGIHIHIKPKLKYKKLKYLLADYKFIIDLQKFAEKNLCWLTRDRIKNNTYCKPYTTLSKTFTAWKVERKYSFVRNHPQGTLEFRFFSTCKHKIENINIFFNYFFENLNKIENSKYYSLPLKKNKKESDIIIKNTIIKEKLKTIKCV